MAPSLAEVLPSEPNAIILHDQEKPEGIANRIIFPDKSREELQIDYTRVIVTIRCLKDVLMRKGIESDLSATT